MRPILAEVNCELLHNLSNFFCVDCIIWADSRDIALSLQHFLRMVSPFYRHYNQASDMSNL